MFGALVVRKVANAMVKRLVKGGIGRISASAERQNTEYLVAKDLNLYVADLQQDPELQLNNQLGCITVVAADFDDTNIDCTAAYQPRKISAEMAARPEHEWAPDRSDDSVTNVLRRANVCLNGPAQSVYEIRVAYSEDGTAFRLESAGYWIDKLLTTKSRRASRHLVYTLELHQPSQGGNPNLLAAAWANVGSVSAGAQANEIVDLDRSDWTTVPEPTRAARKVYERQTAVHQDVYSRMAALQRSLTRDRRLRDAMLERANDAPSETVAERLMGEVDNIEFRIARDTAALEVRQIEYEELDHQVYGYMPLTLELGLTETKSERRARKLLATFLQHNSDLITAAANSRLGFSRSLDLGGSTEEQDTAKDEYYDALLELETTPSEEAERRLDEAKAYYNELRSEAGFDPIT